LQGPPSCLQVMVFMGRKLRLHDRPGFSNPDRSPRTVLGARQTRRGVAFASACYEHAGLLPSECC
jgi:hypothetical protein